MPVNSTQLEGTSNGVHPLQPEPEKGAIHALQLEQPNGNSIGSLQLPEPSSSTSVNPIQLEEARSSNVVTALQLAEARNDVPMQLEEANVIVSNPNTLLAYHQPSASGMTFC